MTSKNVALVEVKTANAATFFNFNMQSRAFLWCLVSCTKKYPLFCGRHLTANLRLAFTLKLDGKTIQLHAELAKMLVLPNTLVLCLRGIENVIHILGILPYRLLNVSLYSQG